MAQCIYALMMSFGARAYVLVIRQQHISFCPNSRLLNHEQVSAVSHCLSGLLCTVASHQGAVLMIWPHFQGSVMLSNYTYSHHNMNKSTK